MSSLEGLGSSSLLESSLEPKKHRFWASPCHFWPAMTQSSLDYIEDVWKIAADFVSREDHAVHNRVQLTRARSFARRSRPRCET